jgi:hypothetical protein
MQHRDAEGDNAIDAGEDRDGLERDVAQGDRDDDDHRDADEAVAVAEQPAGLGEIDAAHARFTMMFLYLTYSASASTPISAPVPLRFHPPNGAHG